MEEKEWPAVRGFTFTVSWKTCFWSASALSEKGGRESIQRSLRFSLSGAMSPWLCCVLGTHAILHYLHFSIHDIFPTEDIEQLVT